MWLVWWVIEGPVHYSWACEMDEMDGDGIDKADRGGMMTKTREHKVADGHAYVSAQHKRR